MSPPWRFLILLLAGLALSAAVDAAVVVAGILGGASVGLALCAAAQCGAATAIVERAVRGVS